MAVDNRCREIIEAYRSIDVRSFQKRIAEEYSAIGDHVIYGGKYAGSDAEHAGSEYIVKELEAIGVDRIEKVEFESKRFQCNDITLTVTGNDGETITYKPGPYSSPGTPEEGITAEIIDAGQPTPQWLEENDVEGKIVLIDTQIGLAGVIHGYQTIMIEEAGAAAIIIYQADNNLDETTLRSGTFVRTPNIPVVGLNTINVNRLRSQLAEGPVKANLIADAECLLTGGRSTSVVAEIQGKTDERIVFSGHLDHYFRCMQDNIASVCGMLGIAKSIIDAGIKPNRTITFFFSSCHELSAKNSLNPYIYGSWYILCQQHPEWIRKIVYDINFEYCALEEKALRSYGSPEVEHSYNEYVDEFEMAEIPGFVETAKDFDPESYILMAWEDSVSFVASGITTIANDPITEQMAGDSPYVGRDHSTSDNMDAFSMDALTTATKWYGGLGLFLDMKPVPELDFRGRTEMLRFSEQEQQTLDSTGCDDAEYNAELDKIYAKAGQLSEKLAKINDGRSALGDSDLDAIDKLIDIRHKFSPLTDTFNADGFYAPLHKKYAQSVGLLSGGIDFLKAGDLEGAMTNCLGFEDYCGIAYEYGINVGKAVEAIADDESSLTWNRGMRSTVLVLPETMESLRVKGIAGDKDFADEILKLQEALDGETALLRSSLAEAVDTLRELNGDIDALLQTLNQ